MDFSGSLGVVLTSAVVASILTCLATLHVSGCSAFAESVVEHRANWRETLRSLARDITIAIQHGDGQAIRVARNQLALHLNPSDVEDQALLDAVHILEDCDAAMQSQKLDEIEKRMSLLLKHDWERVKYEARLFRIGVNFPARIPFVSAPTSLAASASKNRMPWVRVIAIWFGMTGAAAVLFFLAAGLAKPFTDLVVAFNDVKQHHSIADWTGFLFAALLAGVLWSTFYLLFKAGEKRLVEIILNPKS